MVGWHSTEKERERPMGFGNGKSVGGAARFRRCNEDCTIEISLTKKERARKNGIRAPGKRMKDFKPTP